MAKKKNNLTLEEKLQNALVPKEEQPYQIPDNWVWTKLTEAYTNVTSSQKKLKEKEYLINGEYPVIDQGKTKIGGYSNNKELLYSMDLPVIVFGDHTRSIKYIDFNFIQGADGVKVLKPKENWYPKCFYYALLSVPIQDLGYRRHFSIFKKYFIPLPPFQEQQRIVERIESLFSKLDEAKEKIQMSLDSFETRKSAILYQAFSGELTKKWREENGIRLDDWEKEELRERCHINPKKIATKELSDSMDITFISMASVSDVLGEVSMPMIKKLGGYKKGYTNFNQGDVLFAKITPCMENGKIAIVGELENNIGFGSTEFYVFRCKENTYNRFIYHLLRWKKFREEARNVMSGAVGQQRVPKSFLEEYKLCFPSLEEQKEIVRILDTIFDKEQDIQELIDLIEKIDLMKKSILARAFRGELGTNLPEEESAMELLKSILEEQ